MDIMRYLKVFCVIVFILLNSTAFSVVTTNSEKRDSTWYLNNFLAADRLKIRTAFDLAIPRQSIIEDYFLGYGASMATPISEFMVGFNPAVTPRDYDPDGALDLLEEVFGYRYDENGVNGTEIPYFSMSVTSQSTSTVRAQWASLITKEWTNIGIDAQIKWYNWDIIVPKIFTSPVGHGFDYDHGGYDAYLFAGWGVSSPDPDFEHMYKSTLFPPNGQNIGWVENDECDALWNTALRDLDRVNRIKALEDWQQWFYDNIPTSIIPQEEKLYAVRKSLNGFDRFHGGSYLQNITSEDPNKTSLVYTIPGDFKNLNPLFVENDFDLVALAQVHGSLTWRRGIYNLSHPVGFLAESWISSTDGLEWTVKLKKGVKFSDGTEVTADDVVFSAHASMNKNLDTPSVDTMLKRYNNTNNIEKVDNYTVKFTLQEFNPYVPSFIGKILSKTQMENISCSKWRAAPTNTETSPIGFGPYMFDSSFADGNGYDGINTIRLVPNPYYNATLMGHDPNATGGGIWCSKPAMKNVTITVVKDTPIAVTGLVTGVYDIIDANPDLLLHTTAILDSDYGKIITTRPFDFREVTYNQYSSIWGMNPGDPGFHDHDTPTPIWSILSGFIVLIVYRITKRKRQT